MNYANMHETEHRSKGRTKKIDSESVRIERVKLFRNIKNLPSSHESGQSYLSRAIWHIECQRCASLQSTRDGGWNRRKHVKGNGGRPLRSRIDRPNFGPVGQDPGGRRTASKTPESTWGISREEGLV